MNHPYGTYISEYSETIVVKPEVFIENRSSGPEPYQIISEILRKKNNTFYILFTKSVTQSGKFGQIDYISGNIIFEKKPYKYFAYFFSTYDKNSLSEACGPREKDLRKYSFCLEAPFCRVVPLDKILQQIKTIVLAGTEVPRRIHALV